MIEFNSQRAIKEQLDAAVVLNSLVTGIYDDVPQSLDAGQAADFPYITIGDDSVVEWDTDTELGAEITVNIHVWSRAAGRAETKEIQAAIYSVLHRANLVIECYSLVGIEFVSSETFLDADGRTRHGVQAFRLTIEG